MNDNVSHSRPLVEHNMSSQCRVIGCDGFIALRPGHPSDKAL